MSGLRDCDERDITGRTEKKDGPEDEVEIDNKVDEEKRRSEKKKKKKRNWNQSGSRFSTSRVSVSPMVPYCWCHSRGGRLPNSCVKIAFSWFG